MCRATKALKDGAGKAPHIREEKQSQALIEAFLASGLFFLLLPGTFLGVWNLIGISRHQALSSLSPVWLQAHGQAQIFGWVGSFILGIGFYSLTKMRNTRVFQVRKGWSAWSLWTVGVCAARKHGAARLRTRLATCVEAASRICRDRTDGGGSFRPESCRYAPAAARPSRSFRGTGFPKVAVKFEPEEIEPRRTETMTRTIQLKRVYDPLSRDKDSRFLVERLWPRGIKKSALSDVAWLKEVAPSAELRKWFHHDPQRWNEFRRRYFAELKNEKDALSPILEAARNGTVTLLFSSQDTEHNNAVALKEFLLHSLHPDDPACLCLK